MNDLVTYHVNTYNRLHLLTNLFRSFEVCNVRDGFEWVVFDYGSTDGTRDFLTTLHERFENVSVVLKDERQYFEWLKDRGFGPSNLRQKKHSIFGRYRNEARRIAMGDLFVDIADDHQFIRKGDWIQDMLDISEHEECEISSILYRGLSKGRILKANNARYPINVTDSGVPFYRCQLKRYDDYHLMTREISRRIGPYLEADRLKSDHHIADWHAGSQNVNHYEDYLERTKELGLWKVFMKYPYVIDFPNPVHAKLNKPHEDLIAEILPDGCIEDAFGDLDRPASSDEIVYLANMGW